MATIQIYTCDRCGDPVERPRKLRVSSISMSRDLCPDCIEALRAFLIGRPDATVKTVFTISERELQDVYRRGAEALEAWALGATADDMAQHVRDMLSHAKREATTEERGSLLGIAI